MPDGRERTSVVLVNVALSEEEVAALEGWRRANAFESVDLAARELLRLGLMSELQRSYNDSEGSMLAPDGKLEDQT